MFSLLNAHSKSQMPRAEDALPGRDTPMPISGTHFINGHGITPPFPEGVETAVFGMGC